MKYIKTTQHFCASSTPVINFRKEDMYEKIVQKNQNR